MSLTKNLVTLIFFIEHLLKDKKNDKYKLTNILIALPYVFNLYLLKLDDQLMIYIYRIEALSKSYQIHNLSSILSYIRVTEFYSLCMHQLLNNDKK